jgi:predicted pyridoxine 5'-phosphate oxidase superfamily flavin-nucleotide-binding protein
MGVGTYRFVSQANLDAFKANPAKYEPAYGGFCAYGAALGKKFDGDPRYWKIVDGRLYLNLNGDIQTEWSKDISGTKADTNWGRIQAVPVHKSQLGTASNGRLRTNRPQPAMHQDQMTMAPSSDIAFTPSVKAAQQRRGSRSAYARLEAKGGWATTIEPSLADFIAEMRSFYLATASKDGQPYVQHRGGPPGFLRVIDERTLAFADFSGNRQYITTGNLAENPRAMIFLMDYANRQRVKIWGTARVVENDAELNARLFPEGYKARVDSAILFTVEAWDANCPHHIPQMLFADDVAQTVDALKTRIGELEAENTRLRGSL